MKGNELKPRIGLFGRCNAGKSSLINYLTGQEIAIVSDTPGTTTDPVRKSMELGGIGPVVLVDTAGVDDPSPLGSQRVQRSLSVLPECDLVVIVHWGQPTGSAEEELRQLCQHHHKAFIEVDTSHYLSHPEAVDELVARIRTAMPPSAYHRSSLLSDVVQPGDTVVMVCPIDSSAPEGRMILPQVQVLRDVMDLHAKAVVCQPPELADTLAMLKEAPRVVITDSQAFAEVAQVVPAEVELTSFSVVLARQKGLFSEYLAGTPTLGGLSDTDRVLLLESCTHNISCEDIGRVKLPRLIARHCGHTVQCDMVAGTSALPDHLEQYRLAIQCGGCVVSPTQLRARLQPLLDAGVAVSNYGLALAYLNGIFERSTHIFSQKTCLPAGRAKQQQ